MKRKLQIADLTHRIYLMEQAYSKLDQEHDKLKAENEKYVELLDILVSTLDSATTWNDIDRVIQKLRSTKAKEGT